MNPKPRKRSRSGRRVLDEIVREHPGMRDAIDEVRSELRASMEITRIRERAGLTQSELATLIGTTQSAISRAESGDYDGHTVKLLGKIARALGVKLVVKFVGKPEPLEA